jgi:probable F420-dependent oxidoreductase
MSVEVSLGLWQDRPPEEVVETALLADQLGYPAVWIGEMATWDAFALGTHVGARMANAALVLGPFAVAVRDPMMIAMGSASVAALTGRPVEVALGTSSDVVVQGWHGRERVRPGLALAESAEAVRLLLDGAKAEVDGTVVRTSGYRLRLPPPRSKLTVAAFGRQAVAAAARWADRMVLNLIDPTLAGELVELLTEASAALGRPRPRVAVWCACAVDAGAPAITQLRRSVVGYLAAPGYREMFTRAGFGELVEFARTRPHPAALLEQVSVELIRTVGLVGDAAAVEARMKEYQAAGVDDVVIVPAATDDDPAGAASLRTVAEIAARLG